MQDARHELHCFYDIWLSHHQELATLLDNKDSTGVDLFIAEHPHFDFYTVVIEHHTKRCNFILRSPKSTPDDYTTLHNWLWSNLMTATWLNFREEICLPDIPTIYHHTSDPLDIENHHVTFAITQS